MTCNVILHGVKYKDVIQVIDIFIANCDAIGMRLQFDINRLILHKGNHPSFSLNL